MDEAIKRMAKDIVPELEDAIERMFQKPGAKKAVEEILWDNKICILRILQAAAE